MTAEFFNSVAGQWGIGMALFIGLFVYVLNEQKKLTAMSNKREEEHHKYMEKLKDDIYNIACQNHTIVKTISDDVDVLHDKMQGLAVEVDKVKIGVEDVKKGVDYIQHSMVIRTAKAEED